MTVYENIAFPLRMRKEDARRIDGEVRRVTEVLGLGEFLLRKPKELSGGQRQRVALGRAIVRRPKVFLMDEPLSNLDARLRLDMRTELKNLHRELGITTVYVTHDQGEAMGLSDRIAVLEKGVLQQCAAPCEVYRHPANIFVAGFIGSPPMNFLRCAVVRRWPLELDCNGLVIAPRVDSAPAADEVIIGIRPDDISLAREPAAAAFTATVQMIEPAGSTVWIDAMWGKVPIRAVAGSAEAIEEGSEVRLALSLDSISVFDGATGRAL
jgi:multiple sugar transport system ATP-binding protein